MEERMTNDRLTNGGPSVAYPSREVLECPYQYYAAMREDAPVYKVPGGNQYVVSRHKDIVEALRKPEIFSNVSFVLQDGVMRDATLADLRTEGRVAAFQASDPPVHTVKRRLAFEHFTKPAIIRTYEPDVERIVNDLLDQVEGQGTMEVVRDLGAPLACRLTMVVLNLQEEDWPRAVNWARYDGQGTRYLAPERQREIGDALVDMNNYARGAVHDRHDCPRDDRLTKFVQAHVAEYGEELGLRHATADVVSLISGGIITTVQLLAHAIRELLEHPDELARAIAQPALFEKAVEETMRRDSPVQWNGRMAVEDTELAGVKIPAGATVILLYASGSRDPERFHDADAWVMDRPNAKQHLGFGLGTHFCLGGPLLRLEARVALRLLFARLRNVRLAEQNDYALLPSLAFHGLKQLQLDFDTA
jgi:cytochrome P450